MLHSARVAVAMQAREGAQAAVVLVGAQVVVVAGLFLLVVPPGTPAGAALVVPAGVALVVPAEAALVVPVGVALVVPAGVALLVVVVGAVLLVVVGVAGLLEVAGRRGEESEDACHPLPPPTPLD